MKKLLFITTFVFIFGLTLPTLSFAQGMMGNNLVQVDSASSETSGDHTEKAEAEGKIFWEKLQAKEINCEGLSDDNFHSLGMYFMGLMTGESHETMDTMMEKMMGEDGGNQMHIAMGKRMSGCEPNAPMPQGMMSGGMMQMMMGGWSSPFGSHQLNNSMMNFGFMPFGGFGWIFMILWWVLIIVGIVALIIWLMAQSHGSHNHEKSPLEILKERYAKGEIDKKEFQERKKDLS